MAEAKSARVFLSWSGPRSNAVAAALRDLIKVVIQSADPWMSAVDISAGGRWSDEIARELNNAVVGIICVTPENKDRPWLNFEAGAISKVVNELTYTCPYLLGLEKADVTGPMSQFQMVKADREGTRAVIEVINNAMASPLRPDVLTRSFDAFWEDFAKKLQAIPAVQNAQPERPEREILEELLNLTRDIARRPAAIPPPISNAERFKMGFRNVLNHRGEMREYTADDLRLILAQMADTEMDTETPPQTPKNAV